MRRKAQDILGSLGSGADDRARRLTILLGAPLAAVVSLLALAQLLN